MSDTPKIGLPELSSAQAGNYLTVNDALRIVDALLQATAVSVGDNTPPVSPADGDLYVLGNAPTGAWAGHSGDVAFYQSTGWIFVNPREGWKIWATDDNLTYRYSGSSALWEVSDTFLGLQDTTDTTFSGKGGYLARVNSGATAIELAEDDASFTGRNEAALTNSQVIGRFAVVRGCVLPANLSGSVCKAGVAATGSTTIDVKQNGSNIGTIVFSASGTTATFTTTSGTAKTLAVGDVLTVVGPASADGTLAQIGFTLRAYRNAVTA
jgi:hypothetical protein